MYFVSIQRGFSGSIKTLPLNNRNKVNHLEMIGKVMALMDRFAKVFFGSLVSFPLTLLGIIDFFL